LQARAAERARPAAAILVAGLVLALVMMVVRPVSVLAGTSQLTFPYAEMAREIAKFVQPPAGVIADHREDAANIAIRIPGLASVETPTAVQVLVIASDPASAVSLGEQLDDNYKPAGEIRIVEAPWHWHPRRT